MRKNILFAFLLNILSCAAAQKDYKAVFVLQNYPDSVLYIKGYYGDQTLNIDTLKKEGQGVFRFQKNVPSGIYHGCNASTELFAFVLHKDTAFSIILAPSGYSKIEDSEENTLFFQFQYFHNRASIAESQLQKAMRKETNVEKLDSLKLEIDNLRQLVSDYQQDFSQKHPTHVSTTIMQLFETNPIPKSFLKPNGDGIDSSYIDDYFYHLRTHYWDRFPFEDDLWLHSPYFFPKLRSFMQEFSMPQVDSSYANLQQFLNLCEQHNAQSYFQFAINYYLNYTFPRPISFDEVFYSYIVRDYLTTHQATWLLPSEMQKFLQHAENASPFLPGKKVQNLLLKDANGIQKPLYKTKGKYILLMFWSQDCPHCITELPALVNFYDTIKQTWDFEIYAVEIGNNKSKWTSYLQKNPLAWINVYAEPPLTTYPYPMLQTPDFYLLNSDFQVVSHTILYSHLMQILQRIANKNP